MTNVIAIVPLNAANFDSTGADNGDVLTANGAGGAAFAAPTGGGGGVAFAYDGATFVISEKNGGGEDPYWYEVGITLTDGGDPITAPTMATILVLAKTVDGGPYWPAVTAAQSEPTISIGYAFGIFSTQDIHHVWYDPDVGLQLDIVDTGAVGDWYAYAGVVLPDGSTVISDVAAFVAE